MKYDKSNLWQVYKFTDYFRRETVAVFFDSVEACRFAGSVNGYVGVYAPPWLAWWDRFRSKAIRIPPDPDQQIGCLIWVGAQSRGGGRPGGDGYGSFRIANRLVVRAHIVAAWVGGLIDRLRTPVGMHVDHECNRSLCVEPTHMTLKPLQDNCKLRHSRQSRPLNVVQEDYVRYRQAG